MSRRQPVQLLAVSGEYGNSVNACPWNLGQSSWEPKPDFSLVAA
jgi:hypothetical protein